VSKAKEAGRATACLSNLRQIGIALQLYVQDNNNRMPMMRDRLLETNAAPPTNTLPGVEVALSNYLGSAKVLVVRRTGSKSMNRPGRATRGTVC